MKAIEIDLHLLLYTQRD